MRTSIFRAGVLLLTSGLNSAVAMPVLGEGVPGAEKITVLRDHQDPHLYYIAPNTLRVAVSEDGVPEFSYIEYKNKGLFPSKGALIQTLLIGTYDEEYEAGKQKVLEYDPHAKFAALYFNESKVTLGLDFEPLVAKMSCNEKAGVVGDIQSCTIVLTSRGRKALAPMLKRGITFTVSLEYSISGYAPQPDGSYRAEDRFHSFSGKIGGRELKKYPRLFRRL